MPVEETQRFCPSCQRNVLARRPGTNHVLHLLLSILTVGLWLVVWVLASVRIGGWRCTTCGTLTRAPRTSGFPGCLTWGAVLFGVALVLTLVADRSRTAGTTAGEPSRNVARAPQRADPETSYRRIAVEDISIAAARRFRVRIEIPQGRSREQLEGTLRLAATEIAEERRADAVVVFAYRPGDDTNGVYSVGKTEYAPMGDWAAAADPATRRAPKEFKTDIGTVYFADESTLRNIGDAVTLVAAPALPSGQTDPDV